LTLQEPDDYQLIIVIPVLGRVYTRPHSAAQ
jgi:hypothetical protein